MTSISSVSAAARDLASHGVAYAPEIAAAAARHRLNPRLLAAVAAQETGGPGSNAGRNIVGDGGHGRGLFQIDDRYHAFARSNAAMDPQANAEYAAGMIAGLLHRYGDTRAALSAYNAGDPHAHGTITGWADGSRLGYADSVLRHYTSLGGNTTPFFDSKGATMNLLGGLATGLTTLVETGNPYIAAGVGAMSAFGGGSAGNVAGNLGNAALGGLNAADEAFQLSMYSQQMRHQEQMQMQSEAFDEMMDERSEQMRQVNTLRDVQMQQRKADDGITKKFIQSITE